MFTAQTRQFRAYGWRFAAAIAGGGASFISDYLAIPGASASFLEGIVPYSPDATDEFLGVRPESYCSEKTARLMASQSRLRALALEARAKESNPDRPTAPVAGIAATAALASDRPKKGPHRVYCAVRTGSAIFSATLNLHKDARSRAEEERLAADFILSTALFAAEKLADAKPEWRENSEKLAITTSLPAFPEDSATVSWAILDSVGASLLSETPDVPLMALCWRGGQIVEKRGPDAAENAAFALYPGSFNPPHHGHIEIVRIAEERLQRAVALELAVKNVDKPSLDPIELLRRLKAIEAAFPDQDVWIDNAPRYVQKAQLFRGAAFIMGADTVLRLADPKYEGGLVERRDAVLERLKDREVTLCVFARKVRGELAREEVLRKSLPKALCELCDFVPEDVFLDDVSSSEIRNQMKRSIYP